MRLSTQQVADIKNCLQSQLGSNFEKLCLYGSRIRDDLKGGDIDLLLFVVEKNLSPRPHELLNQLKKIPSIGDRRIDLKIIIASDLVDDPFLKSLQQNWIEL